MRLQNLATFVAEYIRLRPKTLLVVAGLVVLLLLDGRAWAQTVPALKWNEDRIGWSAPTQCADGSPLSDCPITGYKVEAARSATSTNWIVVATVGANVLTYLRTSVQAGENCYRVSALSGATQGPPSSVECDTADAPAPGAPTLRTVDTVAYDVKFDWRKFRYALNKPVGTVNIGTVCRRDFQVGEFYRVERKDVDFGRRNSSSVIVAKCG